MDVQPIVFLPDGTVGRGSKVNMGVIVLGVAADRIGRQKMSAMKGGNNSRLGCQFCHINGTQVGGCLRPLGYVENVKAKEGKCKGERLMIGQNDTGRLLDHAQQKARASAVDDHMDE